jgi:hypothetical protein
VIGTRFTFGEADRSSYLTLSTFLRTRLSEPETVEWALSLGRNDQMKRQALADLLETSPGFDLLEPWRTAWRLIQESWQFEWDANPTSASVSAIHLKRRMDGGDESGDLIAAIVRLVSPRLSVESRTVRRPSSEPRAKRPKQIDDLLYASLKSSHLIRLEHLNFDEVRSVTFLSQLITALDAALSEGLDIARRLGWDGHSKLWRLGMLRRLAYTATDDYGVRSDIDEFHQGIAPSVKLLHAAMLKLAEVDVNAALPIVQRWEGIPDPIHMRLLSSLYLDSRLASDTNVETMLLNLDDKMFWDLLEYPEIARLRAARFCGLSELGQGAILSRLKKGPPSSNWAGRLSGEELKSAKVYWSAREFRRIQVAGCVLPRKYDSWLQVTLRNIPDLVAMNSLDEGFLQSGRAHSVAPDPDPKFDHLIGIERLRSLEAALSSTRAGWNDDPEQRASDWISTGINSYLVINDFEQSGPRSSEFPLVWDRFGWTNKPVEQSQPHLTPAVTANRVTTLLLGLTPGTLRKAIEGVTHWISTWEKIISPIPEALQLWEHVWPVSVNATNAVEANSVEANLNAVATGDPDDPQDLDTLNTAAGRMVGFFLAMCPNLTDNPNALTENASVCRMRDQAIVAPGRSGLIVKHRLLESLRYFLRADRAWTVEHLLNPLSREGAESLALWRAVARRTQFDDVLQYIGDQLATRASDRRLGRDTRKSLAASVVIEMLHAYLAGRTPTISISNSQQMLRSLDDETRASAAQMVQRFVADISKNSSENDRGSAEHIFRTAVAPFLTHIWPQETSLATPGVSGAFADLPATCGQEFIAAVGAIRRFLVPFDCWSMLDFGLWRNAEGGSGLELIDDQEKSNSLLVLLDATIGTAEGSVVPHDLSEALARVRLVAPGLAATPKYRRLATMARQR